MSIKLEKLNNAQKVAVENTEGYVCVIAAAGSGKTRALVNRYYQLLNDGVIPGRVLCITFTNKAAFNMQNRIRKMTGDRSAACIKTFHGLCLKILKEDIIRLGYSHKFHIASTSDASTYLKNVYKERDLSSDVLTKNDAKKFIAGWKSKHTVECANILFKSTSEDVEKKYKRAKNPEMIALYGYLYYQKKKDSLDFNDLINLTLYLFDKLPEVKKKWQNTFDYIMVDEFQDVDESQNRLMEILSETNGNLFVVGDPDQTIYSWRGADFHYLQDFKTKHPSALVINMLENHRSTPEIIDVANSLISHNSDRIRKDIEHYKKSENIEVFCQYAADDKEEAKWIAKQIISRNGWYRYSDMAILLRNNDQSRVLEEVFLDKKIPYKVVASKAFFERKEISVVLGYFRLIYDNDDIVAFERIINTPARVFGDAKMARLNELSNVTKTSLYETLKNNLTDDKLKKSKAKEFVEMIDELSSTYETRTLSELLSDVLSKTGYENEVLRTGEEDPIANITELKRMIAEFEEYYEEEATLENYLDHVSLLTKLDDGDESDRVQIMTMHAAKGLEFPVVFMAGMVEGIIPSYKTKSAKAIEEERRVAFVGITRAQEVLYLTCNGGSHQEGNRSVSSEPSRFLYEIDPKLMKFKKDLPKEGYVMYADDEYEEDIEEREIEVGDMVHHRKFGEGTVIEITEDGYKIDFNGKSRSLSFDAPLIIIE